MEYRCARDPQNSTIGLSAHGILKNSASGVSAHGILNDSASEVSAHRILKNFALEIISHGILINYICEHIAHAILIHSARAWGAQKLRYRSFWGSCALKLRCYWGSWVQKMIQCFYTGNGVLAAMRKTSFSGVLSILCSIIPLPDVLWRGRRWSASRTCIYMHYTMQLGMSNCTDASSYYYK